MTLWNDEITVCLSHQEMETVIVIRGPFYKAFFEQIYTFGNHKYPSLQQTPSDNFIQWDEIILQPFVGRPAVLERIFSGQLVGCDRVHCDRGSAVGFSLDRLHRLMTQAQ